MKTSPGPRALAAALLMLVPAGARAGPPVHAPVNAAPLSEAPLRLVPERTPAPYRPLSREQLALLHRKRRRHLGLLGAGGVLALGGATFGLISRRQESGAKDAPNQVEVRKTLSTAHRNGVIANVGFAGAGLAVVGALVAYLVRPPLPPQPQGAEVAR